MSYLGVDTQLGIKMASYIKEMSGAAVTDSERALYTNLLRGGSLANKEAAITAITNFVEAVRSEGDEYRQKLELDAPWTYRILGEYKGPDKSTKSPGKIININKYKTGK